MLTKENPNLYSQFGEDFVLQELFKVLPPRWKKCIEFGANDGLSCSNTANLWKKGWRALLIERDESLIERLVANSKGYEVSPQKGTVGVPGGAYASVTGLNHDIMTLDEWAEREKFLDADLVSIDVDGDDYHIFKSMKKLQPMVVVVEFNPTMPFMEYVQRPGDCVGSSWSSLRTCHPDYDHFWTTENNSIFVRAGTLKSECQARSIREMLMGHKYEGKQQHLRYAVSDYKGNYFFMGAPGPWGEGERRAP